MSDNGAIKSGTNGASVAATGKADGAKQGDVILRVEGLKMYFPITSGLIIQRTVGNIKAVDGLNFSIKRGETLGLEVAVLGGGHQPLLVAAENRADRAGIGMVQDTRC